MKKVFNTISISACCHDIPTRPLDVRLLQNYPASHHGSSLGGKERMLSIARLTNQIFMECIYNCYLLQSGMAQVVMKALAIVHILMNDGNTERVVGYLASNPERFNMTNFKDRSGRPEGNTFLLMEAIRILYVFLQCLTIS